MRARREVRFKMRPANLFFRSLPEDEDRTVGPCAAELGAVHCTWSGKCAGLCLPRPPSAPQPSQVGFYARSTRRVRSSVRHRDAAGSRPSRSSCLCVPPEWISLWVFTQTQYTERCGCSRMPARTSVLMQGTDTMRRSSGLVERFLRFADNVVAGAKTLLPKKHEGLSM